MIKNQLIKEGKENLKIAKTFIFTENMMFSYFVKNLAQFLSLVVIVIVNQSNCSSLENSEQLVKEKFNKIQSLISLLFVVDFII